MIVAHRHDVRASFVNLAMNDTLEEQPVLARAHGLVVEIELDDVIGGHIRGRHAAGEPIVPRIARITRADMSVGLEDAAVRENLVRRHEVLDQLGMRHVSVYSRLVPVSEVRNTSEHTLTRTSETKGHQQVYGF
jgi:hypothetical protein